VSFTERQRQERKEEIMEDKEEERQMENNRRRKTERKRNKQKEGETFSICCGHCKLRLFTVECVQSQGSLPEITEEISIMARSNEKIWYVAEVLKLNLANISGLLQVLCRQECYQRQNI
jgi:hypothetical protein